MPPKATSKNKASTTSVPKKAPAKKAPGTSKQPASKVTKPQAKVEEKVEESVPAGITINLKQIDTVLKKDGSKELEESGKSPLVIDPAGRVATFLRHRDTNYLNVLERSDMEPERIRMALIGAIRFGKPMVVDMVESDMTDFLKEKFDSVEKDLLENVLNRSIMKDKNYLRLVRPSDGEEYDEYMFNDMNMDSFKFVIVTQNEHQSASLKKQTFLVTIE